MPVMYMYAHIFITWEVTVTYSFLSLIRTHQHGIAKHMGLNENHRLYHLPVRWLQLLAISRTLNPWALHTIHVLQYSCRLRTLKWSNRVPIRMSMAATTLVTWLMAHAFGDGVDPILQSIVLIFLFICGTGSPVKWIHRSICMHVPTEDCFSPQSTAAQPHGWCGAWV